MNLTISNITFLKDVHSSIKVDMRSGWRHHYFDGSITDITRFIESIGDDRIYLLIPLFAKSTSTQDATLNLSEPFLVDNKSNPGLIINFIMSQWNSSGFSLREGTQLTFAFKFKNKFSFSKKFYKVFIIFFIYNKNIKCIQLNNIFITNLLY